SSTVGTHDGLPQVLLTQGRRRLAVRWMRLRVQSGLDTYFSAASPASTICSLSTIVLSSHSADGRRLPEGDPLVPTLGPRPSPSRAEAGERDPWHLRARGVRLLSPPGTPTRHPGRPDRGGDADPARRATDDDVTELAAAGVVRRTARLLARRDTDRVD